LNWKYFLYIENPDAYKPQGKYLIEFTATNQDNIRIKNKIEFEKIKAEENEVILLFRFTIYYSEQKHHIITKIKNMKRPAYVTDKVLKQFIKNALEEDIQDGDHSTLSTIPKDLEQSAKLLVKQDCILAGVELAEIIFKTFDKNLKVETFVKMVML
jgi:hypothetical protein